MNSFKILSFKHAWEGIITAFREQPNLKFHFFAALGVVFLGYLLQINQFEWIILLFLIGLVISLELTNSAIEEIVDSFTQEHHPGAKKAKDIAAGAVLVAAITSLIVGILIFLPYFY
ncbi:diacylglycerol kinase family protein [Candidatus Daviesbacteria bacterium]|nr:diacylglycerol kinase family protein [Candidatus Daviesbacteria bacterium]